jgi:UDP-GlcNAc3NAcA epimerase
MRKVFTIVGARPQFVKAAVVSRAFATVSHIQEFIVHTGQHHDANMSDVFFDEMQIPRPAFHLGIHGLGHGAMTGRMTEALEALFIQERPDMVLVYGDTNSTLAGALAAVKLHIPIAHVEAGLRSFNMRMPEEVNRILTDRVSNLLFCPTVTAVNNLHQEGFPFSNMNIIHTGDVMYDAALYYSARNDKPSAAREGMTAGSYALCTLHRAENTDDPQRLSSILNGLSAVEKELGVPVLCPLHPRTRKKLADAGIQPGFRVIDPVGYFDMLDLLKHAKLVITDSGGLQKEAYFFEKPCVTLRDETEWTELISAGVNTLTGAHADKIVQAVHHFIQAPLGFPAGLYGDGTAGKQIAEVISTY